MTIIGMRTMIVNLFCICALTCIMLYNIDKDKKLDESDLFGMGLIASVAGVQNFRRKAPKDGVA